MEPPRNSRTMFRRMASGACKVPGLTRTGSCGDDRPASLVPTHPAGVAEDAARRAVEGIGIPNLPAAADLLADVSTSASAW